ncbi:MAG: hypothetical protein GY821_11100 [Gammaproteobacteria bacterium]|nr:hypothetical protein [Gammaproteobacteria bacterium]
MGQMDINIANTWVGTSRRKVGADWSSAETPLEQCWSSPEQGQSKPEQGWSKLEQGWSRSEQAGAR